LEQAGGKNDSFLPANFGWGFIQTRQLEAAALPSSMFRSRAPSGGESMDTRKYRIILFALIALILVASSAFAQANNGSVGGVVQDASKALIPGVTITLTNTQTGVVDSRLTNESGAYSFPSVLPGTYKLTGDLTGFRQAVQSDIRVGTSAQIRIDLVMQVGAAPGEIVSVVTSNENAIQESAASVGNVLTEQRVRDLPIVGNNVLDLLSVLPGFRAGTTAIGGAGGGTVGGMGLDSVNATINGLSTNSSRDSAGFWGYQTFTTTVVNPDLVRAQVEGGVLFGLSAAAWGEVGLGEGGDILTQNFDRYPVMRMQSMPAIEVHLIDSGELPSGVGEVSVPTTAPALANAIAALTGTRVRRLPLSKSVKVY